MYVNTKRTERRDREEKIGGKGKQICRTEGLVSEDRRNKATLLFTTPCSLFKSSAKDLSPEILDFGLGSTLKAVLLLGALGRRSVQDTLFLLA